MTCGEGERGAEAPRAGGGPLGRPQGPGEGPMTDAGSGRGALEKPEELAERPAAPDRAGALFAPPAGPGGPGGASTLSLPDQPGQADEVVPAQLGEYRILRPLGRGGMGVVYEAVQEPLGRHVALKVLAPHCSGNPMFRERFRREAQAAARLHHTNIVPVFGVGEHEGTLYYSMQFIRGQGLDAVLREAKRLHEAKDLPTLAGPERGAELSVRIARGLLGGHFPQQNTVAEEAPPVSLLPPDAPAEEGLTPSSEVAGQSNSAYFRSVASLGAQVAEALAYAHHHGVVHRDVKPSNVLVDSEGTAWVADFGLAKAEAGGDLTGTGEVVGTLRYMAPERFRGVSDPRGDVYGLGITLYELLTQRAAFDDPDQARLIQRIVHEGPAAPRTIDPLIPRDLETIVLKATARDLAARYATADALAEDLRRFLADRPILARRAPLWERGARWCRRNPALAVTGGLAVAALLSVAALGTGFAVHQSRAAAELEREQEQTRGALRESRLLAASLALDHGQGLCEQGHPGRGMLWLARSLELAPEGADLRRAIRANLAGWGRSLHRLRQVLPHPDKVLCLAVSPDGKTLLTGCADGNARLWGLDTGELLGAPLPHGGAVRAVAWAPDGEALATAGTNGTAQRWVRATGRPVGAPFQHGKAVNAVAFSPDGKLLATGCADGKARLWGLAGGNDPRLFVHTRPVVALAYSRDGKAILTGSGAEKKGGEVRLWALEAGGATWHVPQKDVVAAVAFGPGERTCLTGGHDWHVRVWDRATGKMQADCNQQGRVRGVAFGRAAGVVLAADQDGFLAQLWDTTTGKRVGMPLAHQGPVAAVAFTPEGRAVTGSEDGTVRVWDVAEGGGPLALFRAPVPGRAERAVFSPDGTTIALTWASNVAELYDTATRKWRASFPHAARAGLAFSRDSKFVLAEAPAPDGKGVRACVREVLLGKRVGPLLPVGAPAVYLAFSPDGRLFLTGQRDIGTVQVWGAASRKLVCTVKHPGLQAAVFSPDGNTFVTASARGTARLWDLSGKPIGAPVRHPGPALWADASPDGRFVVVGDDDGREQCYEVGTGQALGKPLRHQGTVWCSAFGPGGRLLVTGSTDKTARLWEVGTGEPVGPPLQHKGALMSVAFSADGRVVGTGSTDETVRLWDVATGAPLGGPLRHDAVVMTVAFHPDGKRALTCSADGVAMLWEVPAPAGGAPERLTLAAQVATGMELDRLGAFRVLDAKDWQQRRDRLAEWGRSSEAR